MRLMKTITSMKKSAARPAPVLLAAAERTIMKRKQKHFLPAVPDLQQQGLRMRRMSLLPAVQPANSVKLHLHSL